MERENVILRVCGVCARFKKVQGGDVEEGYCQIADSILHNKGKVYISTDAEVCVKNGYYK
ncbi:hypothetical protein [Marseilla massiliensis]|uniref:Uncharacterized protein n=1 Tax=Marseilla massiliensis TaxID=1841864 RepID=A0A939B8X5_9BACT|nr:hypothetical protein [Marseilla massiliensis]MBM6674967.1 hypothetical protein [Marseilla massiliensis]